MKSAIFWTNAPGPKLDATVRAKVQTFLERLQRDDAQPGLHIEKMNHAADDRARTGRVDQSWRAVLYRLDTKLMGRIYVYAGTWPHDEAIKRAQTNAMSFNLVNGLAELVQAMGEVRVEEEHPVAPTWDAPGPDAADLKDPYLARFGYSPDDLTNTLGFDSASAGRLWAVGNEEEALDVAASFLNAWQRDAALALSCGESLEDIRAALSLNEPVQVDEEDSEDDRIAKALQHPASKMQFTLIDDDDELERIINEGDFGSWRVFLHPLQARYSTQSYNGPFRLTGGAGTGKTVVLLHRSRHLRATNPGSSVVLTTFTKALAENLKGDLRRLDPGISLANGLGRPGVFVRGLDQLAAAVKEKAGASFADASHLVVGASYVPRTLGGSSEGWQEAIEETRPDLPDSLRLPSFLEGEYLHFILPARVTTLPEYLAARRPGRGVALDRRRRAEVWRVVERYRERARSAHRMSFPEAAAVAAAWLDSVGESSGLLVDHVLVDEGQDLSPLHWQLLRALARPGKNDLFIAEDTHQRIYGQKVVLARYGIAVVGRSRRLVLNYRTTEQNLQYALGLLSGAAFESEEGELVDGTGYRSARRGPTPEVVAAESQSQLVERVADAVTSWIANGVSPATIALLCRTNFAAASLQAALHCHGVEVNHLKTASSSVDRPVTLTMHTAKGMEFSCVVLYDISEGVMPLPQALAGAAPEELNDLLLRERSLLYVAASRARDALVVTWRGEPSPLLPGLREAHVGRH